MTNVIHCSLLHDFWQRFVTADMPNVDNLRRSTVDVRRVCCWPVSTHICSFCILCMIWQEFSWSIWFQRLRFVSPYPHSASSCNRRINRYKWIQEKDCSVWPIQYTCRNGMVVTRLYENKICLDWPPYRNGGRLIWICFKDIFCCGCRLKIDICDELFFGNNTPSCVLWCSFRHLQ